MLLTETSLGTLFISVSFIFFKLFEKLVFACFYIFEIEPCLTETVMHCMDDPKGNPDVMLTRISVYHLCMVPLIKCFLKYGIMQDKKSMTIKYTFLNCFIKH